MEGILHEKLKTNVGKNIVIFLKNNFRFEGKLLNYDNKFIDIFDNHKNHSILINVLEIKEVYLLNQKNE